MTRARDLAAFVSNADGDIKFDTDTLFIDSSTNRVGIGETAPATNLHISSTANPAISIEDTDNGFAASTIQVENGGRDLDITVPQDIIFTNGSDEAMRITSAFDVSIGTSSAVLTSGNRGNLTISGTAGSILNLAESGNQGTYLFHRSNDVDVFNTTNGYMRFGTNNAERMRILAGGGLTFNGDTAAANALDDYEEGTWTLSVSNSNATLNSAYGVSKYTKIGNVVNFQAYVRLSAVSGTDTFMLNLPFTSAASPSNGNAAWSGAVMNEFVDSEVLMWFIPPNSSSNGLRFYRNFTSTSTWDQLRNSDLASNSAMYLSGFYHTDS